MDRKKAKKIHSARIIMTNIFMGLSVVAIVFILMLVAMGFSFNENGHLEQSGLLQLTSQPRGATVEIDGEVQFGRTEINKMLSSGEHEIRVSKSGYDAWQEKVRIDSGLLTRIEWVRLFPLNPESQKTLTFTEPRLLSFSTDRKYLLYGEADKTVLQLINLQDNQPRGTEIDIPTVLGITNKETSRSANLSVKSWNDSSNRVILTWTNETGVYWYLANLEHPENSINLTAKFGYNFSTILIANDSASKLWAVENSNLHLIDLGNTTINPTGITGIEAIANNHDVIAYLSTDATNNARTIKIFQEGETGSSLVADITAANAASIHFAMGTYWGEEWLTYSTDKTVYVLGGKYPSFETPVKNALKSIIKRDLDYVPTSASRDNEERIVAFTDGTNTLAFDFETKDYFDSSFSEATTPHWLDDYLFWYRASNKIFVQDFDGYNNRELIDNADNELPICLSENNKWLYYFDIVAPNTDEAEATGGETETIAPATPQEADSTTGATQYVLMRYKLNI